VWLPCKLTEKGASADLNSVIHVCCPQGSRFKVPDKLELDERLLAKLNERGTLSMHQYMDEREVAEIRL